ncbi:MAG: cobalamin-binding protein [Syntrophaceae bacterium]|nr:cobalamin-binding protein [Syntrophaceae bacterium]
MKTFFSFIVIWICLLSTATAESPQRIVSLAPNVTEILYELGLGNQVIGVSSYCNYPPEVKNKPKVGGIFNPSLEAIVAMKPDMVVLTDDGNPRTIAERLAKLSIPTYAFRAKRIADLPSEIRKLGNTLGVKDRADRLAEKIEYGIKRYNERGKSPQTSPPPKVLFVVQPEPLMVAGPETAIDDVLKLLNLQNIAIDAPPGYPRFSLEEVIRRSPDIIFMVKTRDGMSASNILLLEKLRTLDAVQKNRVYYVSDPILRMGPRITEGITEVARFLENAEP